MEREKCTDQSVPCHRNHNSFGVLSSAATFLPGESSRSSPCPGPSAFTPRLQAASGPSVLDDVEQLAVGAILEHGRISAVAHLELHVGGDIALAVAFLALPHGAVVVVLALAAGQRLGSRLDRIFLSSQRRAESRSSQRDGLGRCRGPLRGRRQCD